MTEPTDNPTTEATTAAEATDTTPAPAETKSTSRSKSKGKGATAKKAEKVGEKRVKIKLHNSKEIPPGGLHIGINGKAYKLQPNMEAEVPEAVLEVLDNAVKTEPVLDKDNRITGYEDVPRLPYTLVRS